MEVNGTEVNSTTTTFALGWTREQAVTAISFAYVVISILMVLLWSLYLCFDGRRAPRKDTRVIHMLAQRTLLQIMYRSFALHSNKVPNLLVENQYWDQIKENKVQIPINLTAKREVNLPPEDGKFLKVVCIADTHDKLNESHEIPDGDVLIVAGDITNYGTEKEIANFNRQMALRPHKHKLVIAGNHDLGWDRTEDLDARFPKLKGFGAAEGGKLLEGVTYLLDEGIVIDGVKFYGSPWHPNPGYPFYADRDGGLKTKWERIPNDTDVLITHSPPVGYLDLYAEEERWGCRHLLERVEELKPRFHVFGHVHYCNGALSNGVTTFINAAQLRKGKLYENSPIVFYFKKNDLSS